MSEGEDSLLLSCQTGDRALLDRPRHCHVCGPHFRQIFNYTEENIHHEDKLNISATVDDDCIVNRTISVVDFKDKVYYLQKEAKIEIEIEIANKQNSCLIGNLEDFEENTSRSSWY